MTKPCGNCGQPTSSVTGFCRRTKSCKHAYNAAWYRGAGLPGNDAHETQEEQASA